MSSSGETAQMNTTSVHIGLVERFWREHPCLGAVVTAIFLGLVGSGAEIVLYPFTRSQPISWESVAGGLLAVPFYFLVFYTIFRRMRTPKNGWDRTVEHIFRARPLLASSVLSLLVGSLPIAKDAFAWIIFGIPMRWAAVPFALAVAVFCFVTTYVVHKLLSEP